MANDNQSECLGTVKVPVRLKDVVKIIEMYVVPGVRHALVLGIDFWKRVGIVPDVRRGEWYFSRDNNSLNSIECAEELSCEQRSNLTSIIDKYFDSIKGKELGCTDAIKHKIITDSPPIRQRAYEISPFKQRILDDQLDEMLKLGVIEKSTSSWSSPILLVPKKDNSYRVCVDFRKLNRVTERDAYPLPYMSSILNRLGGAKYLTTMDIKSAY